MVCYNSVSPEMLSVRNDMNPAFVTSVGDLFSRPCTDKSHASFENSTYLYLPDLPTLKSPDALRTN